MDAHSPNAAPGSQGLPFEDESLVPGRTKKEWLDRYLAGAEWPRPNSGASSTSTTAR